LTCQSYRSETPAYTSNGLNWELVEMTVMLYLANMDRQRGYARRPRPTLSKTHGAKLSIVEVFTVGSHFSAKLFLHCSMLSSNTSNVKSSGTWYRAISLGARQSAVRNPWTVWIWRRSGGGSSSGLPFRGLHLCVRSAYRCTPRGTCTRRIHHVQHIPQSRRQLNLNLCRSEASLPLSRLAVRTSSVKTYRVIPFPVFVSFRRDIVNERFL
jgi:hypothetical protein